MRSELPTPENEDRRIIPFPRLARDERFAAHAPPDWIELGSRAEEDERQARPLRSVMSARHYLKFMLPSIPITMFVLGFVYCSLLVNSPASATSRAARVVPQSPLPLVGALLFAATSGMLCVMIYCGYLRASGESLARQS